MTTYWPAAGLVATALLGGIAPQLAGKIAPPPSVPAPRAADTVTESDWARRVDRYLAPYVRMRDFSGVVLIARHDTVLVDRAYGLADYDSQRSVTPDTKFGIGSVTKTFTAAAIELLAAQGKLTLHDTLSKFVSGLAWGDSVTLEQLLEHSAGVPDYYSLPEYAAHRTDEVTLDEFVHIVGHTRLDFRPGTSDRYSNSGYKLLAAVIERVSGMRYAAFLQERVLKPLRMDASGDLVDGTTVTQLAPGNDPGFPPALVERPEGASPSWREGNGSMYSTAADLLRWVDAVRNETLVQQSRLPYPYGWGQHTRFGRSVLEQNGLVPEGYASYIGNYSKANVTITVLSNIRCGAVNRIGEDLAALTLGEPYRVPRLRPGIAAPVRPDSIQLAALAGRYQVAPGFIMTVRATSRGLLLAGPDGGFTPLDQGGPREFFFRPLYVPLRFVRGPTGAITEILWDNQQHCPRIAAG